MEVHHETEHPELEGRRRFVGAALAFAFVGAACKAEDDITPGPTAQPDRSDVIVNNELAPNEHTIEVSGPGK
jgi:hypothetical protein